MRRAAAAEGWMDDRSPTAPVVSIVGRSGSGKTALLERLLPELGRLGLRVGALKHTSHGFDADHRGKDSHRIFHAGAEAVALVSRTRLASFRRLDAGDEPSLAEALSALPPGLDLVLAEGFSWEPLPRILVLPEGERPLAAHRVRGRDLRVVRAPRAPGGGPPPYPETEIADLVALLAGLVRPRVPAARAGAVAAG